MSHNPIHDDEATSAADTDKTLLKRMKEDGVEEFYVTIDFSEGGCGPDEFRVAFMIPKPKN